MTEMRALPKNQDAQDQPDPETDRVVALKSPVRKRRGYGGALLAAGVLLLLTGGLAMGGWRHYQAQRDVAATAQQSRQSCSTIMSFAQGATVLHAAISRAVITETPPEPLRGVC